ncbi:MAG TPA: Ig-like domain-containing protein [Microbacteriaceae bacterium]
MMPTWLRGRKAVASIVALAVLVGVPLTAAVLHKGFPVKDVNLDTRDVWVTNGEKLLAGRLNHQIGELDASVAGESNKLDVLQDSSAYFLTDAAHGVVERIDPAYVTLVDRFAVPPNSHVSYGGNTLAVLSPAGSLWVLDASARINFDQSKTKPDAKLGQGAQVVVSKSGITFADSPAQKQLVTVDHPGAQAQRASFAPVKHYQLSAVGDHPVVLDTDGNRLVKQDGSAIALPRKGLRVQQPGEDNTYALVASGSGLLKVPLGGGSVTQVSAGISTAVTDAQGLSAPVWLNGCAYGAWAGASRYLYSCDNAPSKSMSIDQPVTGDDLEFRVNHSVIALNNLRDGNAWVVSSNMQLVQNWAMLKPSETTVQGNNGQEKPVLQSFEDTLAHRTAINHPPVAVDDNFGARPNRTTVLPVLANDTDPDGDVLTITEVTAIPTTQGRLDVIEGGRAIQFTPAHAVAGTVSFRYTIDDGRGGTASAQVNVTIHPLDQNAAPVATRTSTADAEVGQSVSYNVLNDWIDPDGDGIYLLNASSTTDDGVQFTPDGYVTFTSKTGQTGSKEVKFTVSDGTLSATGSLLITVHPAGTLDPVAVPDFGSGFAGAPIVIHPLANDASPSGEPLGLVGAAVDGGGNASVVTDTDKQTVTVLSNQPGEYYVKYTLGAGSKTTVGLIRVNVLGNAALTAPPIAVQDTAYLRPGESTTVNVLDNDSSPSGRVLVVRSVTKSADASDLNVEVLDNAVVKITAPTVLSKQVQLEYTVSDGPGSATAGITVVPIAPLVTHQPPVAVDDTATVRAGDIASVSVMDNDYSPDNEPFTLDPKLHDTSKAGQGSTVFVSGKLVRYQAPKQPGQYSVVYGITDKYGQQAQATLTFVVTALDNGSDRAPNPGPLTVRAFAGSTIPVTVPLNGIDPDGDSVTLDGISSQPTLGRITASDSTSFSYQAYPDSAGTDTFSYRVKDTYGKEGTGIVSVGVIKRPDTSQPPIAVNDTIEVKPGKTASVPVLDNDSDPNGYTISLQKKLLNIDPGLKARTYGKFVLVTVPATEGVYLVRYQITNGQGGQASAFVQVIVDKNAKPQYPTAIDQVLEPEQVADKTSVKVTVRDGATNPSGIIDDLQVSLTGANASAGSVGSDGTVTVRPGNSRMAITYTLTDPQTGLGADAFIVVPARGNATAPPRIKPGLPEQIVQSGGTKSWKLSDIIDVPSGRSSKLTAASATNSDGRSAFASDQTITFTGAKGYRGPAAVTFKVDDGRDPGQSRDRITSLVLPLTIGNPDQSDVPPTFTPPTVEVQPGEAATTVDLRASSYHPNPAILSKLTYTGFANPNPAVSASLSGSTVTVSAPLGTQPGATDTLTFTVNSGTFQIPGSVNVKVVSSQRPIASQKNPPQQNEIQRGTSKTLANAVGSSYWVNPFPSTPLTITKATQVNGPSGATVTYTGSSITVAADSGASIGVVTVDYTVQDATKDPKRVATGEYQVTIHDVPATPDAPVAAANGDSKINVTIPRAPANNGKAIDGYRIYSGGSVVASPSGIGTSTISVTDGKAYTFTVAAHNADGWSAQSSASNSVTTWGKPSTLAAPSLRESGNSPNGTLSWTWSPPSNSGGPIQTYEWQLSNGVTGQTTGTSASRSGMTAGNYSVQVRVKNQGGLWSDWSAASNTQSVPNPPPPTPSVTISKGAGPVYSGTCQSGCFYYNVSIQHFTPGSHTVKYYCNGWAGYIDSVTANSSGSGSMTSQNQSQFNCGYAGTYVSVDGVYSNVADFRQ